MRLLDGDGRILGRINIIDAALLCVAVLAGMACYHWITQARHVAPPFALPENTVWVDTDLWLPPHEAFLAEYLEAGASQPDPRSGQTIAVIEEWSVMEGRGLRVGVRLSCQRDTEGRLLYRSRLLLPGRALEIETETCVVIGTVGAMSVVETAS